MKSYRKLLPLVLLTVVIAVGASYAVHKAHNNTATIPDGPRGVNSVNYNGPTKEETAAGNDQKPKNVARDELNKTADTNTSSESATIAIVDSSQYDDQFEVRAYVSNIFEDGGTCTATFTKAGVQTVTQTSPASSSATNTQCRTINVPITTFTAKGDWQLTVSYASNTIKGSTQPRTVAIK